MYGVQTSMSLLTGIFSSQMLFLWVSVACSSSRLYGWKLRIVLGEKRFVFTTAGMIIMCH